MFDDFRFLMYFCVYLWPHTHDIVSVYVQFYWSVMNEFYGKYVFKDCSLILHFGQP